MKRARKAKTGGGDLTGKAKNRRVCKDEWASGHFLGDSNKDIWTGLSNELKLYLSRSVASITLCDGDTILFSCSGIAMECQGSHLTRFLTSASLVRVLNLTNKDHDDLKIEVRHEGNEVFMGFVAEFDKDRNFAVVNVRTFVDVQVGLFNNAQEVLPHSEVLVVGRDVSGEMMVRSVGLNGDSRVCEDDEDLDCKFSKAWEGGPLLSADGNFIGMNLFLTVRRAVFLPCGKILKHLEHYWTSQQKKTGLAQSKAMKLCRSGARPRPLGEKSNSHPKVHGDFLNQEQLDPDSMGYPKLPSNMSGAVMVLVNTFEDTFGDMHGEGVWIKLGEKASDINDNVVALASFNGEKRFFACSGFFIEWNGSTIILTSASLVRNSGDENKIVENLRIKVFLNNEDQCREGTLQHYSLHYNVALVSVKEYSAPRPLKTLVDWEESVEVAAVGRCFESRALMATRGELVSWSGTLDCDFLVRSTCKISKAGIGGPLVNLDGDVIGMNFFDKRIGTPCLYWDEICIILAWFETKSKLGEIGNDGAPFSWKIDDDDKTKINRWPVPMPCWCHPEDKCDDDDDDELGFVTKSGCMQRYSYRAGKKVLLL